MVQSIKLVLIVLVASLGPSIVVAVLKGRWTLLLAGLMGLFPLLWIAAVKIANPDSWWARRFYDAETLRRARSYQERWERTWSS